ncbi:MAG: hydrogenase maturation nickel metallochaperone HypA [Actinomycetota bacterium]
MHDHQAVEMLVARLTERLGESGRISEVRIRVGPVFSADALEQAFEMLTRDTPLEGSKLLIEEWGDSVCPSCGAHWVPTHTDLAGPWLVCPSCGSPSLVGGTAGIEILGVMGGRTETPSQ